MAMVYAVCKCANKIEAFRYRFVDGQVVLYDKIDTAFTYLNQETDLFKVVMNGVEYTVEDTGAFARYGVQFDVYGTVGLCLSLC